MRVKIAIIYLCLLGFYAKAQDKSLPYKNASHWFPSFDFKLTSFEKPSLQFAPLARWWWPGNNVTPQELKREINLFADNHFGGVEIQPAIIIYMPGTKEDREKAVTWDTPQYYENVKAVMEEARKRGLTIDMTDGSGWPPGGPHLAIDDGFLNLQFASLDVQGGADLAVPLPKIVNRTGVPSNLVTVIAAKTLIKGEAGKSKTIPLDASSTVVLSSYVKKDSLHWKAPQGNWKILAFWSKPSGSKGMTATPVQGYIVNHFDSTKVLKSYNHLFGERTGLQPYFGNPMRSIFNDSYEFQVDRFYSLDLISYFKRKRGYDITPFLPAEMQKKYNYVTYLRPDATPDFSFSSQDWRLRYDYDLTLSELLGEHFFNTSKRFMEPKGLLHRTQPYGMNLDMIKLAGLASIPEAESMLGAEANIKAITSGGHLYNRPIISAEAVVFKDRAYMTTPQKVKLAVDKLFAAGVNQIIYHGIPYRYTPPQLGLEGWYPFSTPIFSGVNFASNLGESNVFWKYQKQLNDYVSRIQYALRAGKPRADVLIYFPFLDIDGMPDNPEEILTKGYIAEVEAPLPASTEKPNSVKEQWAKKVYPLINQLDANGITWDWVNDESIQAAALNDDKQINIRGNVYQALILANDSIINLATAQAIEKLASKGMKFVASGTLPYMQPSYLNWEENDRKTAQFIKAALEATNSKYLQNEAQLNSWIKSLRRPIQFRGFYQFLRKVEREMSDGSQIQFIWNKTNEWQTLSLMLDKKYTSSYWMDAEDGTTIKNNSAVVTYQMAPYSSVILFASTSNATTEYKGANSLRLADRTKETITLDKWDIKADSIEIKDRSLFDWKVNDQLKFSSAEGIYTTSFQWNNTGLSSLYYLDLGKVCYTAEVYINEKFAGRRIYAPYMLDITPFLQQGTNKVEVRVTTGQLNGFIGKAEQGDVHYKQFKGQEDQLMSGGLIGPVLIRPGVSSENE